MPAGGKPVHAFHVLDVFPKVGLMRGEQADRVVEIMDSCRVRWGRVLERIEDQLVVNVVPLRLVGGQPSGSGRRGPAGHRLAGRRGVRRRGRAWATSCRSTGTGPATCSTMEPLGRLVAWTRAQLDVANQSL